MDDHSSSRDSSGDEVVRHRKVLASQHHQVETVVNWLEDLVQEQGVDEEILHRLLVAASEAVNNSLCHGNRLNPVRDVVVEVTFTSESIDVVVQDEGVGFEPERVDDPLAEENLWKEGGRGVYLIEELADAVDFEDEGRRVCMHFAR